MAHYVVFVHGIGEQRPDAYDPFMARLGSLFPPGQFNGTVAYWADLVQPDEYYLNKLANRKGVLNNFFVGSFGDVVAYSELKVPEMEDRYTAIQKRFSAAILDMSKKANNNNDTEAQLSVIGHSLGSVIASDGLYNMINNKRQNSMPTNLTFNNFFTFGSPIALWGLRYGMNTFNKPIQPNKVWLNFYYPQDIVAFPLKSIYDAYKKLDKLEDVSLSPPIFKRRLVTLLPLVGHLVGIWSHSWYFSDMRMLQRIAKEMKRQLPVASH